MTKNRLYIKSMMIKQVVNTDKDITSHDETNIGIKMTYREKHQTSNEKHYKNNEKYRGNKKSKITRNYKNDEQ